MSLNVNLPGELEQAIRDRAMASGMDVDTFVTRVFSEQLAVEKPQPREPSSEEFHTRLRRIIALHPKSRHFVDDSRQSIYAGCGE